MKDFLLYASVFALFVVCLLVVIIILMQRPSANAGMGSALGGGAAESVFGGESANVLSRMTTTLTIILFILSFGLYLGFVSRERSSASALGASTTPATTSVNAKPAEEPKKAATPAAPAATAPTAPAATTTTAPATTPAAPAPAGK